MQLSYTFHFDKSLVSEKNAAADPELCGYDATVVSGTDADDNGFLQCTGSLACILAVAVKIDAPQSDIDNINNL